MTITVNAASLQTLVHDTALADASAEAIIDHAVNKLNLYGASVTNLSSGTGSYTSAEAGAILDVAAIIYAVNTRNSGAQNSSLGIGGLNISESSASGLQMIAAAAKEAAGQLRLTSSGPPIFFANPPIE